MVEIGKYNTLTVVKAVDFGVYLDGEERGEILLPGEYVPANCFPGDEIKVFVYFDSEDRIVATTEKPNIVVGEFAWMKVVAANKVGAFLDWGLRKDLLVPFREQREKMSEGCFYLVYAYVDEETDRIVATSKIEKYLDKIPADYENGQEVDILIARPSDLGYNVIIEDAHWGLIYRSEIFTSVRIGQKMKGYIRGIRPDGKIDVCLQPSGYGQVEALTEKILEKIRDNGGVLDISDKTDPRIIYNLFGCSKKNYKKAIGALYKRGKIELGEGEIRMVAEE